MGLCTLSKEELGWRALSMEGIDKVLAADKIMDTTEDLTSDTFRKSYTMHR